MNKHLFTLLAAFVVAMNISAQEKMIIEKTDGTKIEYYVNEVSKVYFTVPETPPDNTTTVEAVDLGLSVKWASCNVGASSPEQCGGYYAWGETEEKSSYAWENSLTNNKNIDDIAGTQYDVAHVKWGGSWRMPTSAEIQELIDNCTWTWTTVNGVNGQKVTSANGNSIFLPAAGYRSDMSLYDVGVYGYCWSSTPNESRLYDAYGLYFNSNGYSWYGIWRYYGYSVRPVSE